MDNGNNVQFETDWGKLPRQRNASLPPQKVLDLEPAQVNRNESLDLCVTDSNLALFWLV